jgi:threonine dehydrogenase-like Zn-dependent dehydrogenase
VLVRALIWNGSRELAVGEVPEPEPQPGEVIVEIAKAGICGSDLHAFRGDGGRRVPPLVLGHEAVGHLVGDDRPIVILPLIGCGTCALCQAGNANLCTHRSLLGLDRPGTFAERVAVTRESVIPVPDGLSLRLAVLAEPLATSIAVLDRHPVSRNHKVIVIGCGAIGLLALHAAGQAGAEVEVVDPVRRRREAARRLGAAVIRESVDRLDPGRADLVIDAVGIEATWNAALAALRPGGTAVVVGLGQQVGSAPIGLIVRSGLRLEGSYAYRRQEFVRALELLAMTPPEDSWITELPIADGPRAFADLADRPAAAVKVLLDIDQGLQSDLSRSSRAQAVRTHPNDAPALE